MNNKKFGFTLAEVLITLAIIGVVAALTLPTLMTNYQEKATVTKLQKAYSSFTQAYQSAIATHGNPADWGLEQGKAESGAKFLEYLKPYMNITRICKAEDEGCFAKEFKDLSGNSHTPFKDRIYGQLHDGTWFWVYVYNKCSFELSETEPDLQNICFNLKIDTSGINGPNVYGKDMFEFYINTNRIIPGGSTKSDSRSFETFCNINDKTSANNGDGCAAWVIENGNMDYLHCSGLSWNGKHRCSE